MTGERTLRKIATGVAATTLAFLPFESAAQSQKTPLTTEAVHTDAATTMRATRVREALEFLEDFGQNYEQQGFIDGETGTARIVAFSMRDDTGRERLYTLRASENETLHVPEFSVEVCDSVTGILGAALCDGGNEHVKIYDDNVDGVPDVAWRAENGTQMFSRPDGSDWHEWTNRYDRLLSNVERYIRNAENPASHT